MKCEELIICGKNLGSFEQIDGDTNGIQYGEVVLNDHIFMALKDKGYTGDHEGLIINADIESGDVYIISPYFLIGSMKL